MLDPKCDGKMAKYKAQKSEQVMTNGERQAAYRLRQKELGRLKREFYLTDDEVKAVKAKIAELRA